MKADEHYLVLDHNLGTRHMEELVFHPNKEAYPNAWVRLADEFASVDDKVVEEILIYKHDTAQSDYKRILKKNNCVNTREGVSGKKTPIYLAPDSMVFPFAEKVFTALRK